LFVYRTVGEVTPGLISKCLNGRAKMKERAFDIILMYVEIEKQVDVEEELVKGLENKQPKIVQACLELLRKGLSYVLESRVFFNELLFFFQ
jgi:cytoskeleton-associated protein 5